MELIYGLVTGILFGFLMQRAHVIRYDKQVGAMRLLDMTIFKFMLSAIIVGMIGIYLLKDFGIITLSVKATSLGANIIGGLIFGIGWALLGYCPGTAAGALGEGRWDALIGIIGMLIGAAIYAEVYPAMKSTILVWGSYGKITLADILGLNHWVMIAILTVIYIGLFYLFEKNKL
ncbi:MAG: YeeE/YedE family protein [Deltaproteobacteria bacterium]|nr:YeeE/YedE family protein [Deltaproteobacteria bacterium]MBN2844842.1 YeeE/YedE family protein [Deltaproteobacteria bacterium]